MHRGVVAAFVLLSSCAFYDDPAEPQLGVAQGDGHVRKGPLTVLDEGRVGVDAWRFLTYESDEGTCYEVWFPSGGLGKCGFPFRDDAVGLFHEETGVEDRNYFFGSVPLGAARVEVELANGDAVEPKLVQPPKADVLVFVVIGPPDVGMKSMRAFTVNGREIIGGRA